MHRISTRLLAAVFLGGVVGAVGRWQLGELFTSDFAPLMLVNLLGSFLIGIASGLALVEVKRVFLQTGVLGSFTSMSAVIAIIEPDLTVTQSIMAIAITFFLSPIAVVLGKQSRRLGAR